MRNQNKMSIARLSILLFAILLDACAPAPRRVPPPAPVAKAPEPRLEAPSIPPQLAGASVQYDQFRGSCAQMQEHMRTRGVVDCDGETNPGWLGATRCVVHASSNRYTPQRTRGPRRGVCVATDVPGRQAPFRLTSACIRIVDWIPTQPITPACRDQRAAWLNKALAHERQHALQCQTEVTRANQRWLESKRRFLACDRNESAALARLKAQIETALQGEHRKIMESIARESARFHRSAQGAPIATSCSICK